MLQNLWHVYIYIYIYIYAIGSLWWSFVILKIQEYNHGKASNVLFLFRKEKKKKRKYLFFNKRWCLGLNLPRLEVINMSSVDSVHAERITEDDLRCWKRKRERWTRCAINQAWMVQMPVVVVLEMVVTAVGRCGWPLHFVVDLFARLRMLRTETRWLKKAMSGK